MIYTINSRQTPIFSDSFFANWECPPSPASRHPIHIARIPSLRTETLRFLAQEGGFQRPLPVETRVPGRPRPWELPRRNPCDPDQGGNRQPGLRSAKGRARTPELRALEASLELMKPRPRDSETLASRVPPPVLARAYRTGRAALAGGPTSSSGS